MSQDANRWTTFRQSLKSSLGDITDRVRAGVSEFCSDIHGPTSDLDPSSTVDLFAARFSDRPNFIRGTASEAARSALKRRKLLAVFAYSADAPDCTAFCRDLLCQARVLQWLSDNCICWLADVGQRQGWLVHDAGFERRTILGTVSNGSCFTACHSVDELVAALDAAVHSVELPPYEGPAAAPIRSADRHLFDEQELAFQQSLLIDQAREFEVASSTSTSSVAAPAPGTDEVRQQAHSSAVAPAGHQPATPDAPPAVTVPRVEPSLEELRQRRLRRFAQGA